jgi:hypothetical protein
MPTAALKQWRELFATDAELLFALETHLRLFEAEKNSEAADLVRQVISEMPRTPRSEAKSAL